MVDAGTGTDKRLWQLIQAILRFYLLSRYKS
jgi:hypothetical protein